MSTDLYKVCTDSLSFDGGVTCATPDVTEIERVLRFSNGSGDDVLDAVAMSLDYEEFIDSEAVSPFDDPLDILIALEEDE